MDRTKAVEVSAASLKALSQAFLADNKMMSRRVTTLSFIICGFLGVGGFWYIGALERLLPTPPVVNLTSAALEVSKRLGAVVVVIFLVRIFVPLLRYAAELEIFYRSRAGVLDLLASAPGEGGKVRLDVQAIVDVLSSDKIQLAAAPESPVAELVSTAKLADKA